LNTTVSISEPVPANWALSACVSVSKKNWSMTAATRFPYTLVYFSNCRMRPGP
jgi:hypothetical protein